MKQTRRPEDEEQLNKTPETPAAADAPQEEPAYSLEEIMNEFGGWTKRDAPAPAEPVTDETVRLAVPAAEAKGEEKPAEPPAGGDTIRFTPVEEEKAPEPERPAVWTYRGEPDPERPAPDPKEARELARAERREKRQAEKRRRQLERFQKKEARKKRAQEQPEHTFASPEAAYAFYAAASGTRLRLLVSTLLCLGSVLLLVLSTPLITGAFSDHAAVFSAAMLGLLLLQAVCSYDVCLSGVIALLRFRFDQYSMLFLALCAVVADAFFAVAEGRTPFCTVASILLLLALWGRDLLYDARRRSLRAISNMDEPVAAIREEKAWHGYDCIFRAPGDAEQFAVQLEMPDAGSRIMRVWAPVMTAVTLALSVLTSLRTGEHFLWAWSAMLLASFPAGILIAYAKPFSALARRLYRAGAAIAGWQGARILSGEAGLIVEDADLFPPQNVTQGGMKLYGSRPAPMVIGYANAVVQTAGSGLVPLFEQMMHDQNGRRYTVDTFRRYEGGGLGATIRGDVVLMGSIAFMKLMRVRVPEGTRLKQAVYLSVNGELTAVFALNYAPAESVRAGLSAVLRAGSLVPVLATRDFMITPQFLKLRYKIPPEHIEFPIVEERARLSSQEIPRTGPQGALMARSSFASFAGSVVSGADAARRGDHRHDRGAGRERARHGADVLPDLPRLQLFRLVLEPVSVHGFVAHSGAADRAFGGARIRARENSQIFMGFDKILIAIRMGIRI